MSVLAPQGKAVASSAATNTNIAVAGPRRVLGDLSNANANKVRLLFSFVTSFIAHRIGAEQGFRSNFKRFDRLSETHSLKAHFPILHLFPSFDRLYSNS